MGGRDDYVLDGPKFPIWGCSKCGSSHNWASRIKCRCGSAAPTRIIQAAKREAAALKLHPKTTPKSKAVAPKVVDTRDKELADLRAENRKLRAGGVEQEQAEGDEAMGDNEVDLDVTKVESALAATVTAFGEKSKRAIDLSIELEELRAARLQSRPLSLQFRKAENRVRDKRRAVEVAKAVLVKAEAAASLAQQAAKEAEEKIKVCEKSLLEAEEEHQRLLRQPTVPVDGSPSNTVVPPPAPTCFDALTDDIGDDPEAAAALAVIRSRIAARTPIFEAPVLAPSHGPIGASGGMDEVFFARKASARTTPYGA